MQFGSFITRSFSAVWEIYYALVQETYNNLFVCNNQGKWFNIYKLLIFIVSNFQRSARNLLMYKMWKSISTALSMWGKGLQFVQKTYFSACKIVALSYSQLVRKKHYCVSCLHTDIFVYWERNGVLHSGLYFTWNLEIK